MSTEQIKDKFPDTGDFFQTIFESSPYPMWVYDLETMKFLAVNNATVEHYGYTREEFLSMNIKEIRPPEEVPRLVNMISRLGMGVQHLGSWKHRRKDGSLMDVEISSHGILFEGRKARFVIIQDVTERKRTEWMLRASEERHRLILGTAMDGFWLVDTQGHLLEVNEAYCRMSGYSEQELLTMSISDLDAAELPAETASHIQKVISEGEDRFESVHRRKDGSTFNVEVSVQFKPIEGGRIVGFMRDITARRKTEKNLRESEERLRVRSQELEEMNSALKVLLKQREQDKKEIEEKVQTNVKQLVLPYIEKLKKRKLGEDAAYLNIIEANLHGVISSLATTTSVKLYRLTPQELLVANLIKDGRQDKDISEMLSSSINTIKAHRRNIRKKLGLTKEKTNLRTFLSNI
jgi:PAS domain S-box-containing protein